MQTTQEWIHHYAAGAAAGAVAQAHAQAQAQGLGLAMVPMDNPVIQDFASMPPALRAAAELSPRIEGRPAQHEGAAEDHVAGAWGEWGAPAIVGRVQHRRGVHAGQVPFAFGGSGWSTGQLLLAGLLGAALGAIGGWMFASALQLGGAVGSALAPAAGAALAAKLGKG